MTPSINHIITRLGAPARRLVVAGLMAVMASQPASAQQAQPIGGTSVSLVAPKGFKPATGFAGLQDDTTMASLLVVEMPAEAYPQLQALFGDLDVARTNFGRQNIAVETLTAIDTPTGEKAPMLRGKQTAGGARLDKWMALYKGPKTVMITVQAPESAKLAPAEIQATLASVSLGKEATLDEKLAALPFAIAPSAPFRVIDTIGGSGVLMTVGERNVDPESKQPLLIAAYQLSMPAGDGAIEALAESQLRQTRDFQNARIEQTSRVPFAGTQGVLITGRYDHRNGTVKAFAQYMAVGADKRFVRLIAQADEAGFAALKPAIDAVAASVAFKAAR